MRFIRSKKGVALLVGVVAVAASAVGAYAYFTTSGTGTGSATVGSSASFTVASSPASGGALYPDASIGGAHIDTIDYSVTNPGSGSENLNQVVISVANSDGSAWTYCVGGSNSGDVSAGNCTDGTYSGQPACVAADFSLNGAAVGTPVTDTSLAGDLAASGVADSHVTIEMIDDGANQDNCEGVTVPLYFSAS